MDLKFSLYRIDYQERDYWAISIYVLFIDAKGIAFIFVLVFYKHAVFPTPRQQ